VIVSIAMTPSFPRGAVVPKRLSEQALKTELAAIPLWARDGDAIERSLIFGDFASAFGFMTAVAIIAERVNHHPEWSNVYNRVSIRLTTHDVDGLSDGDIELATHIDRLAGVSGSA
jgi:4a-hydroxytetrahydrobiopterin dehydratase